MTDIGELAGLDIEVHLDEAAIGIAFDPAQVDSAEQRHGLSERAIQAIRPVLMDAEADGPAILYRMYRNMGVSDSDRRRQAADERLRYDITVLRNGALGNELMKTSGHFHPPTKSAPHFSFPETYECIHGTALFLMQKVANASDIYAPCGEVRLVDVILAEVRAGERVIMPPNYGHVMINPTDGVTVTSDWVCGDFSSYYAPYEAHRGAAYYVLTADGQERPKLVANEAYGDLPQCRRARPRQDVPELGLQQGLPLFAAFYASPERFRYLREPDTARDALEAESLFDFE